jgi:glucokinase
MAGGLIGAIDIGGTKIAAGVVHPDGYLLSSEQAPTQPERGLEDALQRIAAMLQRCADGRPLVGVGIGCTGPVDPLVGEVGKVEFLPGWEGGNLSLGLEKLTGLLTVVENDADAAALAEAAWGAGKGAGRFLYVTLSTGIGAGLVLDGRLYRGVGGAHPEIGHHVLQADGPVCPCGAHGCWEALASGTALAALLPPLNAEQICQQAEAGDPQALQAVGQVAHYMGVGLANLVTLYTPDVIALGGGLMKSRLLFWQTILDTIAEQCRLVPYEHTRLLPAKLGEQVGLVGAAAAWLNRQHPADEDSADTLYY